ncbi:MAG: amino acid adenylation domain-containing protein, partial [Rhizobacter sp.]
MNEPVNPLNPALPPAGGARERALQRALAAKRASAQGIPVVDRASALPLSFAQERLWVLSQVEGANPAYNVDLGLRLAGSLDVDALRRALNALLDRHEVLRTNFVALEAEPQQRIHAHPSFTLLEHDLRGRPDAPQEIDRLQVEEAGIGFDLGHDPLVRGRLLVLADDDHVLLLTLHHIVCDGWSLAVIARELCALYGAFQSARANPLVPLPVQYADFAAWQRGQAGEAAWQTQARHWEATLEGAPELLRLPTDRPRPALRDGQGGFVEFELDAGLVRGLKTLGQRHGVTPFMSLLAAWGVLLSRLSGQRDVVIGTPVAGRTHPDAEPLIGFFINALPVRLVWPDDMTVAGALAHVKHQTLAGQAHQDLPFDAIVELVHAPRSLAYTPLFQASFTWQNAPVETLAVPGLSITSLKAVRGTAKHDVSLYLGEEGERIRGGIEYATALFDAATVRRYAGQLQHLLRGMVANDAQSIARLPLQDSQQLHALLAAWNDTQAPYPHDRCVHELFEAHVAAMPDAPAVVESTGAVWRYAELDEEANRLARHLRSLGVGPDSLVGLCMRRSADMVVAMLAILKAGGAYLPLDPSYPVDRLAFMLGDSRPAVVLTHERTPDGVHAELRLSLASRGAALIDLQADATRWQRRESGPLDRTEAGPSPSSLAYVIYTSGSTGRPKGVMVEHRGVCNLVVAQRQAFAVEPTSRVLQFASLSFDACVSEVMVTLCSGAALCMPPEGELMAGQALADAIAALGATHATLTPAVLAGLPAHVRLDTLTTLVVAGEACSGETAARWAPGRRFVNAYGPAEATVCATLHVCTAGEAGPPPIGRPIANVRVLLLDEHGQPVPAGVVGELCIGGVGLARGYLGRPELDAERFIADPTWPGERLYRTGDLGRWRGDGVIDYLGRNDFQLKLRGMRVEPGEIEARLRQVAGVQDAVVLARADADGNLRLLAYCLADDPATAASPTMLREHLAAGLPDFMLPASYVVLGEWPLTPNGKLDRAALPAPEATAQARRGHEAPRGEIEQRLAGLWGELLGVEHVSRDDDFLALGGHSLLVVKLASRIRQNMGLEPSVADLFRRPVLREQADLLQRARGANLPRIEPLPRDGALPLALAQTRLWFLSQAERDTSAYHIPMVLRLRGELDVRALQRALDAVVARHEALRTVFEVVDDTPLQRIQPPAGLALRRLDLVGQGADAVERALREELAVSFDLRLGPLVRGLLVATAAHEQVLMVTMHHIVSDAWSQAVFTYEVTTLYKAFARGEGDPLPPLAIQFADHAGWQRAWLRDDALEAQSAYWRRTLAGAPVLLELPTDRPRPPVRDARGARVAVTIDAALTERLRALGRRHGATLYATVLSAWAALLSRLSSHDEVVIGTPVAHRSREEIQPLIGFFVNTLALRLDLSADPDVGAWVAQASRQAIEAQARQDLPFDQVVEVVRTPRSPTHTPVFQAFFSWQDSGLAMPTDIPGLEVSVIELPAERVLFDLSLDLGESALGIVGHIEYASALFDDGTVRRWAGYLLRLLDAMASNDTASVNLLALQDDAERQRLLVDWNSGDTPWHPACLHHLVERQAGERPDAPALVQGGVCLSYGELDARANRLAHHLRRLGVRAETRVALCAHRSPETIVAMLAILKAGGAYVPLDPAYPPARLAEMLAHSAPCLLLTHAGASWNVPFDGLTLELTRPEAWADETAHPLPPSTVSPHDLAYVIYTSGSTGVPKGVMVEHRAVSHQARALGASYGFKATDRILQFASLNFDASVEEVFGALCHGACLVLRSDAWLADAARFWALCAEHGVTVADLPTRFWQSLAEADETTIPDCVRLVVIGGEAVQSRALAAWFARTGHRPALLNTYGPTETTVVVAVHRPDAASATGIARLGRPTPGSRLYLLDRRGQPVPQGVAGEVHIGGAALARGYLHQPELTAERFVPDPFATEPLARMYRSGDLARHAADGSLEYLGRNDFQVKLRGLRIELPEIEASLLAHPGVAQSAVLLQPSGAEGQLVAYWVPAGQATVDVATLRAHLSARLPAYMVPAVFVALPALPLGPTGKLDRKALPAPQPDDRTTARHEAPVAGVEAALATVWEEVLDLPAGSVGRDDDFFERGGHSLLAVKVAARVRARLQAELPLSAFFAQASLADMARAIAVGSADGEAALVAVDRGQPLALSFAQSRLWFMAQLDAAGDRANHMPAGIRLTGRLDVAALQRALDRVVARHAVLRTRFDVVDGEPVQCIDGADRGFALRRTTVEGEGEGGGAALHALAIEEASAPFDLRQGPLVRGVLVAKGADDHVLLLTSHHIVSDGWSQGVLARELSVLYRAFAEGRGDPLPPLTIQYADYAAWQRARLDGEPLQLQAAHWEQVLKGVPPLLALPTDRPRPARHDPSGASVRIELPAELCTRLDELARRHRATLFMTLLTGWAATLSRLAGQRDLVIGSPVTNRPRTELEPLIGFFLNTLALRVRSEGDETCSEALRQVRRTVLEAQANQDIPFEQVVERVNPQRSLSHGPLFQASFTWQQDDDDTLDLPGLRSHPLDDIAVYAKHDLSLYLSDADGLIGGSIVYATALFDRETVEGFAACLVRVLTAMADDEAQVLERIELLDAGERERMLVRWNETEAPLEELAIHRLIERQAKATPQANAVEQGGDVLGYESLNRQANQLARRLKSLGVERERLVALCMPRGEALVVAMLAIWKAGGAYVPLEPAHPAQRHAWILQDSRAVLVLTHEDLTPECAAGLRLSAADLGIPVVELPVQRIEREPDDDLPSRSDPNDLAYVL